MAEYHQTIHTAIYRMPLRAALALLPSRSERLGHESRGATTSDEAYIETKKDCMAWLRRTYTVQPSTRLTPRKTKPTRL